MLSRIFFGAETGWRLSVGLFIDSMYFDGKILQPMTVRLLFNLVLKVLGIAVIVTGLLLIFQAIPELIRSGISLYMYRQATRSFGGGLKPFDYSSIGVQIIEIIIGLLAIGNQGKIVAYIEKMQRGR